MARVLLQIDQTYDRDPNGTLSDIKKRYILHLGGERLISRVCFLIQNEPPIEEARRLLELLVDIVTITGCDVIPGFENSLFRTICRIRTVKERDLVYDIFFQGSSLLE